MHGPISAISAIGHRNLDSWRNPNLVWPDDRSWFVSTDVDFWSLDVGGTSDFIAELVAAVPTRTERVGLDYRLEIED